MNRIIKKIKNIIPKKIRTNLYLGIMLRKIYSIELIDNLRYQRWIKENEPDKQILSQQQKYLFEYKPKISIIFFYVLWSYVQLNCLL